jgi:hypothetical protein
MDLQSTIFLYFIAGIICDRLLGPGKDDDEDEFIRANEDRRVVSVGVIFLWLPALIAVCCFVIQDKFFKSTK